MVVVQIIIVLARYVFGIGFIKLQELMIYMHGMLFTLASGYTFLHDEHVRVDVIYRESSLRYKSYINFFGSIFLLLPFIYILVKTSLPWKNDADCPVLTGISIHCSLFNRLIEVHAMHKIPSTVKLKNCKVWFLQRISWFKSNHNKAVLSRIDAKVRR